MMTVHLSALWSIHIGRALDGVKERAFQMLHRLQQRMCALEGHSLLLHFETNRLSLRCANCGWHTPGWSVASRADARASLIRRSWAPRDHCPTPVVVGDTARRTRSRIKHVREVAV